MRDYDIIHQKLSEYNFESEAKIWSEISREKNKKISKSLKISKKQSQLKRPEVRQTDKIILKFERKIIRLIEDIEYYLPIVIHDETKIEELHSLRKIVKKLRYTLEIEQENSHEGIITKLKRLQDILGNIRDCDIFIWYLNKNETAYQKLANITKSEKEKRKRIYEKLVYLLVDFETTLKDKT